MCETTDAASFVLAERILKCVAQVGKSLGRQSGIPEFQVADIVEIYNILERKPDGWLAKLSDPNWRIWMAGAKGLFIWKAKREFGEEKPMNKDG